MADEAARKREIAQAQRAKAIVEDELFEQVMGKLRDDCIRRWESSEFMNQEVREDAYNMIRALNGIRKTFTRLVSTGKLAEAELNERESRRR